MTPAQAQEALQRLIEQHQENMAILVERHKRSMVQLASANIMETSRYESQFSRDKKELEEIAKG